MEEIKSRICCYCKKNKSLEEFYNSKRGLYGKGSTCKYCLLQISRKHKKYYTDDFSIKNMKNEIWKTLPNTDGNYEVSNLGRVKSLKRVIKTKNGREYIKPQKIMSQSDNGHGYKTVMLSTPLREKPYRAYIHRLVMEVFKGKKSLEVDHKDENKNNNKISNLRYCTSRENKHFYHNKNKSSSNYIGVSYLTELKKYSSTIKIERVSYNLGYFDKEIKAAEAYKKALKYWKDYKKIPYIKIFYGKRDPKTTGIIKADKKFYFNKYFLYKSYKVNNFYLKEDAIKCKSIFDTIVVNNMNEELLIFLIEEFNNKYYI